MSNTQSDRLTALKLQIEAEQRGLYEEIEAAMVCMGALLASYYERATLAKSADEAKTLRDQIIDLEEAGHELKQGQTIFLDHAKKSTGSRTAQD